MPPFAKERKIRQILHPRQWKESLPQCYKEQSKQAKQESLFPFREGKGEGLNTHLFTTWIQKRGWVFSSVHNTNLRGGSGFVLREGSCLNALMVELSGCFLTGNYDLNSVNSYFLLHICADTWHLSFKRWEHVRPAARVILRTAGVFFQPIYMTDGSLFLPLADDTACEDAFEPSLEKEKDAVVPNPYPTRSTAWHTLSRLLRPKPESPTALFIVCSEELLVRSHLESAKRLGLW